MSQKQKSNQELDNCQIRIILEREKEQLLADMNTGRILPKIIFVICRDKLILKQWKLGILEHCMNSPDENKLHFTKKKNWQIENEPFVILV